MESIGKGWFSEVSDMWPGEAASLQVEEVLFHERSEFQDILVFKSKSHGTVLVLDGVIQLTERDEFAYQEMITHVPMCSHPCPKKVCLIGGGDGGVIREIMRHESVEEIHMCEIDRKVIEIAQRFFPKVASRISNNDKLKLHFTDGAKFLQREEFANGYFDVIIVDCSDPEGPAESLFGKEFYESAHLALCDGGVLCTQAESIWLHLPIISEMAKFISELKFRNVQYAYTMIPTYPSGTIGFFICSKGVDRDCSANARKMSEKEAELLRYYNQEIHCASFVLPTFAKKAIYADNR